MKGDVGYQDYQLKPNIYRVDFVGLNTTPEKKVEFLNLFRCAELTVEKSFTYFVVGKRYSREGEHQEISTGSVPAALGLPSYTSKLVKTRKSYSAMIIVMFKEKPPRPSIPINAKNFIGKFQNVLKRDDYVDIKDIFREIRKNR